MAGVPVPSQRVSSGLLSWEGEEEAPRRGGHPRRRFEVTPRGIDVLRDSRETLMRLWEGLDGVLGEAKT